MPDYGHDLKFGYFLIPDAGDPSGVLATARLIDELGYDLVGIQDHPYHPGHLDSLSLMAVILGQTRRIRAFYSVANLGLRTFMGEVAPRVRERVAARRATEQEARV